MREEKDEHLSPLKIGVFFSKIVYKPLKSKFNLPYRLKFDVPIPLLHKISSLFHRSILGEVMIVNLIYPSAKKRAFFAKSSRADHQERFVCILHKKVCEISTSCQSAKIEHFNNSFTFYSLLFYLSAEKQTKHAFPHSLCSNRVLPLKTRVNQGEFHRNIATCDNKARRASIQGEKNVMLPKSLSDRAAKSPSALGGRQFGILWAKKSKINKKNAVSPPNGVRKRRFYRITNRWR